MPTLSLDHDLLTRLCQVNQFILKSAEIILVGIRGAIVADANDQSFKLQQSLILSDINYVNPRCTILQWKQNQKQMAAFPASTVPNQTYTKKSLSGNENANCLLTGYYSDYRKGIHKAGTQTAHEAFKQNAVHPFRRTSDDLDFDKDDRIEYDNPHDNIHCGWFGSLSSTDFASAGCQVIMGYPQCTQSGRDKNTGPWKFFHDYAYAIQQDSFPYILVTALEVNALLITAVPQAKLRFGSSGPLVIKLQQSLKDQKYYEGNVDGDFGERTMKALISFQQKKFGIQGADGIVGPVTGEELSLDLTLI